MQRVRYILIGIICSIPSTRTMVHIGVKIAIGPASELPIDRAGQAGQAYKERAGNRGRTEGREEERVLASRGRGQGCLMPARLSAEQGAGAGGEGGARERAPAKGRRGGGGTFSAASEPERGGDGECFLASLYSALVALLRWHTTYCR